MELHDLVLQGDRRALSRLITLVENGDPEIQPSLDVLFHHTGRAHLVGVTGVGACGKSSLVNQLVHFLRLESPGRRIGVIAVDPTSPFTGGALLGDRIRMRELVEDPGVFIRSMAARGSFGGIAQATSTVVQVLDAAGFEMIFVETVGAGQSEVEIASMAHTTIVVDAPGLGDDIQAIKAGILEIADIIVLNKADKPGVEAAERALRSMLLLAEPTQSWQPEIILTVATGQKGMAEVSRAVDKHKRYLHESGKWEQKSEQRLQREFENILKNLLWQDWNRRMDRTGYQQLNKQVLSRELSPFQAASIVISENKEMNG